MVIYLLHSTIKLEAAFSSFSASPIRAISEEEGHFETGDCVGPGLAFGLFAGAR